MIKDLSWKMNVCFYIGLLRGGCVLAIACLNLSPTNSWREPSFTEHLERLREFYVIHWLLSFLVMWKLYDDELSSGKELSVDVGVVYSE